MKLIVGLGNIGEKYEGTRHNLGFMVVEQFLKDFERVNDTAWTDDKKLKSDITLLDWQPKHGDVERVILAKPKTYMNNSGIAAQLISSYYKVIPEDIWVVHDDLDLPLGKMKIRFGGAAAGHHGVEDTMEKLGTDRFWRFRLGIGEMKQTAGHMTEDDEEIVISKRNIGDTNDFVLGEFVGKERTEAKKMIKSCSEALQVALEKGLKTAMNRYNTK